MKRTKSGFTWNGKACEISVIVAPNYWRLSDDGVRADLKEMARYILDRELVDEFTEKMKNEA